MVWYSEGGRIRHANRGGLRFCVMIQFGDREFGGKSHARPCSWVIVAASRFSTGPAGIAVTRIHAASWQHRVFQAFLLIVS